jgi:O-antigen/teichoic acid export membrane protein
MLIYYFFNTIAETANSIFNAIGHPEKQVKIDSFKTLITIPLIFFLTSKFGIVGTGMALVIGILPIVILNIYSIIQLTKIRLLDILGTIITPLIGTVMIAAPAIIYKTYLLQMSLPLLLSSVILAGILYLSIIYSTDKLLDKGPYKTIMLIIKHNSRKI